MWLGLLRLSDEPWRPITARGLREEDLRRVGSGEGNSSRETSLSDDVSGSGNDENPEVTMDSQGEPREVGTMSGDGGSVVGEDEDEAATDDRPENRGEHTQIASKNRTRSTGGSGRGRSDSPHARTAGEGPIPREHGRHTRKRRTSKSETVSYTHLTLPTKA